VRHSAGLLAALLVALGVGCASPNGPPYPEVAASAAALAPGQARLVLYRTLYTEIQTLHPELTVDGTAVGALPEGTFLWLDEAAGPHVLDAPLVPSYKAFGAQMPTRPVTVDLAPGTTTYVNVDVEAGTGAVIISLTLVDRARALNDLASLEQAPPVTAGD